jgi:CDP-diacylglycerol---serine O-phosphatidyltransferase
MSGQSRIISNIPNFITILNLLSGCLAILWSFDDIKISVMFIFAAAIFDFADGLAARLLKAYSNLGKELDSLADVVSFGVAPAMIMHHLLRMSIIDRDSSFTFESATGIQLIIILMPFLLVAFSAIRLAKFNLDTRQQDSFIGLPTPASGLLIASISYILLISDTDLRSNLLLSTPLLIFLVLLLCFLMISNIPMFSLKFKNLSFTHNRIRYIFLLLAVVLVIFLKLWALPALIFSYIILSVLNNWIFKLN